MNFEAIWKLFPELFFGIEKDGEVYEIREPHYMSFPYKPIEWIPDYEQYFNGVKIGLFFFPFYRNDPTKNVTGWLIDEIIEWSKDNDLIIQDSKGEPIVLDGTYWSLGRPAGRFIWYLRRKYKDKIIVRNCNWHILSTSLDEYYFDAD